MAVNVGSLEATLGLNNSKFIAGLSGAQGAANSFAGKMQTAGARMQKLGGAMTKFVTLPLIGLGAVAVKTAMDYEQALTNAVSVTGQTGKAAEKTKAQMDKLALALGRETAFSAKEAAEAMYDLASSGWSAADMGKGLRGIMDLAAATQSDLTSTTETVTSTIAQFGLKTSESTRVADVFTKAIGSSKAKIGDLAYSMKYAGPIANSLGWSLESTTAVLSKLYDAGFKGEQAGTALRGAIAHLINPTKEANNALQSMGLKVEDINPKTKSMADIIDILAKKQMSAAQAAEIFGIEAAPAVLALTNMKKEGKSGAEMIKELETSLNNAGGTAKQVAEAQLDTLAGQLKILKGSLETMAIAFGRILIPAFKNFATSLTPVINKIAELPTPVKTLIGQAALVVIALGPVIYIVGTLTKAIGLLQGALVALSANPIMITITAVAVLGAILYKLTGYLEKTLGPIGKLLSMTGLFGIVRAYEAWKKYDVGKLINQMSIKVREGAALTANALLNSLSSLPSKVKQIFSSLVKAAVSALAGLPRRVQSIVYAIPGAIAGVASMFASIGRNMAIGLWNGLSAMGGWLYSQIVSWARNIINTAKAVLGVKSPSTEFAEIGKNVMLGFAQGIKNNPFITSPITPFVKKVHEDVRTVENRLKKLREAFKKSPTIENWKKVNRGMENFRKSMTSIVNRIIDKINSLKDTLGGLMSKFGSKLDALFEGKKLRGDISSAQTKLAAAQTPEEKEAAQAELDAAIQAFNDFQAQQEEILFKERIQEQIDAINAQVAAGKLTAQQAREQINNLLVEAGLNPVDIAALGTNFQTVFDSLISAIADTAQEIRDLMGLKKKVGKKKPGKAPAKPKKKGKKKGKKAGGGWATTQGLYELAERGSEYVLSNPMIGGLQKFLGDLSIPKPALAGSGTTSNTYNVTINATPGTDGRRVANDFVDELSRIGQSTTLRRQVT